MMFLGDKNWAQAVKTNHYLSHHDLTLGEEFQERSRVSAQPKAISELLADFEQSLENSSARHQTGLRGGRQNGYQIRSLGALAVPFDWPNYWPRRRIPKKKARISPFLNFLGDGELEELVSEEDSAAACACGPEDYRH